MRAEALEITIESRSGAVWIVLSGPFHNEQAPNIREKVLDLVQDGNREIVVHMEGVTHVGTLVPQVFLELLNTIRGKDGEMKLVFRNEVVAGAFSSHRNLFSIYPDTETLAAGGFVGNIKRQTQVLFRRTGVRISRPVSIFLLAILTGWFLSLGFIIQLQNRRLREQSSQIEQLTQQQREAVVEIEALTNRLKPMEQLGLLPDSTSR